MFSFTAPSNEAPVYREQKSNIPSNTGLVRENDTNITFKIRIRVFFIKY